MEFGAKAIVLLCWLGQTLPVGTLPSVTRRTAHVPWTRQFDTSTSGAVTTSLLFEDSGFKFACPDNSRDVLMLLHGSCNASVFFQEFLRKCQMRTPELCVLTFGTWFTQVDDNCFVGNASTLTVIYYCLPQGNQFDICSQKHGVTASQPAAILYSTPDVYQKERPCVCHVARGTPTNVTLLDFIPADEGDLLYLNDLERGIQTYHYGNSQGATATFNGVLIWESGFDPPDVLAAVMSSNSPLNITCGQTIVGVVASWPTVVSLSPSQVTLTCSLPRTASVWHLEKFGLAFSTENSPIGTRVKKLQNTIHCQRSSQGGELIINIADGGDGSNATSNMGGSQNDQPRYSMSYTAENEAALRSTCYFSNFTGDITFTATVSVDSTAAFHPQARWHCFHEIFSWTEVSRFIQAPAPAQAPNVESLQYSTATVSCTFYQVSPWPMDRFGLAFFTNTEKLEWPILELKNTFYCHQDIVTRSFVTKISDGDPTTGETYSRAYEVDDREAVETLCRRSSFQAYQTFRMTIKIDPLLAFDPRVKWRCFFQVLDWILVSQHVELPFLAFRDTTSPTVGTQQTSTPGATTATTTRTTVTAPTAQSSGQSSEMTQSPGIVTEQQYSSITPHTRESSSQLDYSTTESESQGSVSESQGTVFESQGNVSESNNSSISVEIPTDSTDPPVTISQTRANDNKVELWVLIASMAGGALLLTAGMALINSIIRRIKRPRATESARPYKGSSSLQVGPRGSEIKDGSFVDASSSPHSHQSRPGTRELFGHLAQTVGTPAATAVTAALASAAVPITVAQYSTSRQTTTKRSYMDRYHKRKRSE